MATSSPAPSSNAVDPKPSSSLPASHPLNAETYALGGGRLTGYEGTIVNSYYDVYRGKSKGEGDKYFPYLVWEVDDIRLADGEPHEPIVVRQLAGWLAPGIDKKTGDMYRDRKTGEYLPGIMPSDDGVTPVGATVDEYRELGLGKASITPGDEANYRGKRTCGARMKGFKNKGDRPCPAWCALESLAKAPVDGTDDTWNGFTPDGWCNDFIGLRCLFDVVDLHDTKDVTAVTRIIEVPQAGSVVVPAKPTTATATAAKTAAASTNGNAAVDDEIAAILITAADASPTKTLTVMQAAQAVQKAYANDVRKMQSSVPRVKEASVHEAASLRALTDGKSWNYNAVKGTMALTASE